jgi:hypothetical protein
VILVVLYDVAHGHFGGLTAAPVFSEIASGALSDLNVASTGPHYDTASLLPVARTTRDDSVDQPSDESLGDGSPGSALSGDDATAAALTADDRIPDFSGLSLRRAFALAGRRHLNLEVEGDGYVVGQQPAPGAAAGTGSVTLRLAPMLADAGQAGALGTASTHRVTPEPANAPVSAPRHTHRGRKP